MTVNKLRTKKSIVFFDGYCNLCNFAVDFILKHEKNPELLFSALSSPFAQSFDRQYFLGKDSLILWDGKSFSSHSSAVLMISQHLKFPWSLGKFFLWIPLSLRDPLYRCLAYFRYKLFGKKETCRLPTAEERGRFLETDQDLLDEAN